MLTLDTLPMSLFLCVGYPCELDDTRVVLRLTGMDTRFTILFVWQAPILVLPASGPLHTRDWEPVTVTLQALSLVEEAELVQVCFPLRSRDQRSMWKPDKCKAYMESYMASNGSCFLVTWTIFQNHLLEGGRLNIKPGDLGTSNPYHYWLILFYHVWGYA